MRDARPVRITRSFELLRLREYFSELINESRCVLIRGVLEAAGATVLSMEFSIELLAERC